MQALAILCVVAREEAQAKEIANILPEDPEFVPDWD